MLIRLLPFVLSFFLFLGLQAQSPYKFGEPKMLPCTPVKNQQQTGTCWSFSTVSMIESELIRSGIGQLDLSEMFIVRHIYRDKCENYVRRQGKAQFSEGGLAHDAVNAVKRHGLITEEAYTGRKDERKPLNHTTLLAKLTQMCDKFVAQGKNGTLPSNWLSSIDSVLDQEFGRVPNRFIYKKSQTNPKRFRDLVGFRADDYVSLTSFTHHPFNQSFVLEIPDNFANGLYYNLPTEDLIETVRHALEKGYSVTWDADVSNPYFSAENGLAIVPEKEPNLTDAEAKTAFFKYVVPEKSISQEYRQEQFDRLITQDDHLMHIVGTVEETNQKKPFFVVKNSWGEISNLKGMIYVSEPYIRLNTISISVHKDALPDNLRNRLGLLRPEEAAKLLRIKNESRMIQPAKPEDLRAPGTEPDQDRKN